jgi:hypothetical protein
VLHSTSATGETDATQAKLSGVSKIGRADEPSQTLNDDYVVCIWTGLALRRKKWRVDEHTSVPHSLMMRLRFFFTTVESHKYKLSGIRSVL